MENTNVTDLPFGSIVGSAHAAYFKDKAGWVCTHTESWHHDSEITKMVQAGQAHVLRVGLFAGTGATR